MSKFNLVGALRIHTQWSKWSQLQLHEQLIDKLDLNAFEYSAPGPWGMIPRFVHTCHECKKESWFLNTIIIIFYCASLVKLHLEWNFSKSFDLCIKAANNFSSYSWSKSSSLIFSCLRMFSPQIYISAPVSGKQLIRWNLVDPFGLHNISIVGAEVFEFTSSTLNAFTDLWSVLRAVWSSLGMEWESWSY